MKLAVFGATGRTGKLVVEQALKQGHEVFALVRTPAKMGVQHECLHLIQGDALNAADVEKTILGVDAVLNTLGPIKGAPVNLQTTAMQHIISAMEKNGVKRMINLIGAGIGDPNDRPKFIDRIFKFVLWTFARKLAEDVIASANLLRQSKLDWTIVRVPRLLDKPATGKYRIGWVGVNSSTTISRADVADFMLKQLTDSTYVRVAPMISD